ncbi:hypothetical protein ACSS6W_002244 [Trichoderma asperelloides]|uniref:Centromere protein V n=1 Tax=Trichoderma asperellum TaxID=101201 RepID=A0A6V8QTT6_TRIAP|nr:hypothetical protein LI328DRAFT_163727 [Trichoderma asperelloides]GFP54448.1 centromere protein V [Trichoderma asperellum]
MSYQALDNDSASTEASEPRRLPYTGSCHCGNIRYVVFLTLPPASLVGATKPPPSRGVQHMYRCNCTICHKTGFLHVRPASAFDDFFLLSPLDPLESLGDYQFNKQTLHNLFCKTCSVRCFTIHGEGEIVETSLPRAIVFPGTAPSSEGESVSVKAWRLTPVDFTEGIPHKGSYLSVNGHTVDAEQEGFDLREWVESKCIGYIDILHGLDERKPARCDRPQVGGSY